MERQNSFNWAGALRALLGRFPSLEDEPQLGALLQSQVHCLVPLIIVRHIYYFECVFLIVSAVNITTIGCSHLHNILATCPWRISFTCPSWAEHFVTVYHLHISCVEYYS